MILGDPLAGHDVQHVVPAGTWQAGEVVPGGAWSFFGVTMAPAQIDHATPPPVERVIARTPAPRAAAPTPLKLAICRRAEDLLASHPARESDIERLSVPGHETATMPGDFQS